MADEVPQDPKVRAIVQRIEQDLYRMREGKQLQQSLSSLEKDWTDLKEYFIYTWIIKPKS